MRREGGCGHTCEGCGIIQGGVWSYMGGVRVEKHRT